MKELYIDHINPMKYDRIEDLSNKHSTLRTEITITDYKGDQIIKIQKHRKNMTVLAGRIMILEKLFGITPIKSQRKLITEMIPNPSTLTSGDTPVSSMHDDATYASLYNRSTIFGENAVAAGRTFADKVNYFCIGNGGENPNTAYEILDVHDWETRLYNMVPFRCRPVSNDLTSAERANYRLRKQIEIAGKQYYAYYAKIFNPGIIHSERSGQDYNPAVEDSNPYVGSGDGHTMRGHSSTVYVSFDLDVTQDEFKEFYRALHNNSLSGARLSELGLISGYDVQSNETGIVGAKELVDATLAAKLTHDVVFLSSNASRRKVTYKVFS